MRIMCETCVCVYYVRVTWWRRGVLQGAAWPPVAKAGMRSMLAQGTMLEWVVQLVGGGPELTTLLQTRGYAARAMEVFKDEKGKEGDQVEAGRKLNFGPNTQGAAFQATTKTKTTSLNRVGETEPATTRLTSRRLLRLLWRMLLRLATYTGIGLAVGFALGMTLVRRRFATSARNVVEH